MAPLAPSERYHVGVRDGEKEGHTGMQQYYSGVGRVGEDGGPMIERVW